jgi:hypothetical protein
LEVSRALKEDDPTKCLRRREIAERENWPARAEEISEAFQELLGLAVYRKY